jgi:[FeFe] hydrogenase H-cluster maturation GTPase HydF
MAKAPRGERLIITIVGRRNAGKSSLINALTNQELAIVSDHAGTTTDPVAKSYELLPLGPVTLYDTAGIDDVGELGEKRIAKTNKVLLRSHIAILVVGDGNLSDDDHYLMKRLQDLKIPYLVAFNKSELHDPEKKDTALLDHIQVNWLKTSAENKSGITELKDAIINLAPSKLMDEKVLVGDLIDPGDTVLLIAPIDLAAPKGRLILPQVQVLREILDNDAIGMIVKEREIEAALRNLSKPPKLVVTDSQVVLKVAGDVPDDIMLTTFSILFARYKGDLDKLIKGAEQIDKLEDGDKVLIAETCSHSVQCDDIGRVKIPRWLTQYTGKKLVYDVCVGHDFPENLSQYNLILHCGACMLNNMEMNRRILEAERNGTVMTNYGVAISKLQGVLDRALVPFRGRKVEDTESYFTI